MFFVECTPQSKHRHALFQPLNSNFSQRRLGHPRAVARPLERLDMRRQSSMFKRFAAQNQKQQDNLLLLYSLPNA
jgi:hypothetical protein